jgi:hypothetical protein
MMPAQSSLSACAASSVENEQTSKRNVILQKWSRYEMELVDRELPKVAGRHTWFRVLRATSDASTSSHPNICARVSLHSSAHFVRSTAR